MKEKEKYLTLFHGSNSKSIKNFKINEDKMNDLGYGIYLAEEVNAERYVTQSGSLYQIVVKLENELFISKKTIDISTFSKTAKMLLTDKALYYAISDYKMNVSDSPTLQDIEDVFNIINNDCKSDKDFFDFLYCIDTIFITVFEYLGYTHTYSNLKGFAEWCILPGAIISSKEIKNSK